MIDSTQPNHPMKVYSPGNVTTTTRSHPYTSIPITPYVALSSDLHQTVASPYTPRFFRPRTFNLDHR